MKPIKSNPSRAGLSKVILLVGILALPTMPPVFGATVLRTLAYHQVTQFTNTYVQSSGRSVVLSADGRKIACARPWYSSPRTNLVHVVNFDGTGSTLVDMWEGDASP
jgi:hypothetical protein